MDRLLDALDLSLYDVRQSISHDYDSNVPFNICDILLTPCEDREPETIDDSSAIPCEWPEGDTDEEVSEALDSSIRAFHHEARSDRSEQGSHTQISYSVPKTRTRHTATRHRGDFGFRPPLRIDNYMTRADEMNRSFKSSLKSFIKHFAGSNLTGKVTYRIAIPQAYMLSDLAWRREHSSEERAHHLRSRIVTDMLQLFPCRVWIDLPP
jgi:hypothetical protein